MGEPVQAIAEFDYEAMNSDELTLKVGDVISKIKTMEGGWWEGTLNGKTGMFPDNFVEVIEKKEKSMKSPQTNGQAPQETAPIREGGSERRKKRYKVAFSYAPQNSDELELKADEVVDVISKPEEGWWEGVVNGKKGMFPSNFVVESAEESTKAAPAPDVTDAPVHVERSKVAKVGFGDIFKGGKIILKPTLRTPPIAGTAPAESKSKKTEEAGDADVVKEKARVDFDYDAENEDELELKKGEIITVLSKDAGDIGWWKGELNGKKGVFPDNFVTLIPPEEKPKLAPARPSTGPRPASGEFAKKASIKTPVTEERKPPAGAKPVLPIPAKKPAVNRLKPAVPPPDKNKTTDPSKDATKRTEPESNFDEIKSTGGGLTHATKNRPKPDNRRPPSSTPLASKSSSAATNAVDTRPDDPHLPPWAKELRSKSLRKPAAEPIISEQQSPEPYLRPITTPSPTNPPSAQLPTASLRPTTRPLSSGSSELVTKEEMDEIRKEFKTLHSQMASMRTEFKKEMNSLMQELDEEKKHRMSMQVEYDRIKKLVMNKH